MEKRKIYVETPKGIIREVKHRDGSIGMTLIWSKDFSPRHKRSFENAQEFVDSECIRMMKPYTPMQNGILHRSATLGTVIGSGEIKQVAPYARYQYYGKLMVSSVTGSAYARGGESKILTSTDLQYSTSKAPLAGSYWFERMKADKKEVILKGAAAIAGGKSK